MRHPRAHVLTKTAFRTMTRTLELNCLDFNNDRKPSAYQNFPIELSDECTVATLKEKIKEEIPCTLQHIPAEVLKLWSVSILGTEEFSETQLREIQQPTHAPLLPEEILSDIFPNTPLDQHLHIVARHPGLC